MNEQGKSSPTSNSNPQNSTVPQSPSAANPVLEMVKDYLDIIFKIVGIAIAIIGAFWVGDLKDKISAASLLAQREQAETNLRATMFNNLMERIVTKDPKTQEEPEKMLLLAELLALNFDEHFQFKPMLADLQKKLSQSQKLPELESIARRIVDRQTDILRSAMRTQGDEYQQDHEKIQDIFISDLFFEKHSKDDKERQKDIPISYDCNYIDLNSFKILDRSSIDPSIDLDKWSNKLNTQQQPALFIYEKLSQKTDAGFSQCVTVVSPDLPTSPEAGYLLDIAVLKYNPDPTEKTVTVSINVMGDKLRGINTVYEFDVTPFDFPLTDNTAIDSDHRFAIVQRYITENEIWLRLIWFPKGYITARERPINYAEMRDLLEVQKEKKKWYEFYK